MPKGTCACPQLLQPSNGLETSTAPIFGATIVVMTFMKVSSTRDLEVEVRPVQK